MTDIFIIDFHHGKSSLDFYSSTLKISISHSTFETWPSTFYDERYRYSNSFKAVSKVWFTNDVSHMPLVMFQW